MATLQQIRYEYFTVDPGTFKGGCPDSVLESSHLPRKRRMVLDRIMCASDLFRENTQNRSDSGTLAAVRVSDHKSADKNAVARPRPFDTYTQIIPLITRPKDYSFPSGHTCASFAVALVCLRMLPGKWGILPVVLAGMIAFPDSIWAYIIRGMFWQDFWWHCSQVQWHAG